MAKTKLKKPESGSDDPDLTPMIDVIFLLIIFFLIAGRMIQQGRPEIVMPIAEAAMKSAKDDLRTEFTVDKDGKLYHLDHLIGSSGDTDKMQEIIEKKRSLPGGEKHKVYLRADATAKYGDVKRVMAACAAKGQTKILFASYIKEN